MKLLVHARGSLIDRAADPARPALLLEGSWPAGTPSRLRWSLDDAIDGRFDWIDRQAADWTELLAEAVAPSDRWPADNWPFGRVSVAYLNALALRYYLVKMIRLAVYLDEFQPLRSATRVELIATEGRDEDYADLISQHCRAAGVDYRVRWGPEVRMPANRTPANAPWRRWGARLCECLRPMFGRSGSRRRIVLCGNPRLLDPVCRELVTRRCDVWWLYDRFAAKSWLRWQAAGVGQLVCNSSQESKNRLSVDVPEQLQCRGLNLAGPLRRWLARRTTTHGPGQTRLLERIDAHFGRVRPEAIVLDEDATPMARAAVAVARRHGAHSSVVQHGVPGCRFGFAPLAADRILVWGQSSRQRLVDWDVPPERIRITGSPQADELRQQFDDTQSARDQRRQRTAPARILLLATVPPRDGRPDSVALHLTRRTYAEMLRMAFAAAAKIPGAELIVKLHPRSPDDPVVREQLAAFPTLRRRVVRKGPFQRWLRGVDCVLSYLSTAGVEATLARVPVIQLAPRIADALPHEPWGLAGTARDESELDRLLDRVLAVDQRSEYGPRANVYATFDQPAAARIADEVLAPDMEVEKIRRPKQTWTALS